MPLVLTTLTKVHHTNHAHGVGIAIVNNNRLLTLRTVDHIAHGIQSPLEHQPLETLELLHGQTLLNDLIGDVLPAAVAGTLQQLDCSLLGVDPTHVGHAVDAEVVSALVQSIELTAHLLFKAYQTCVSRFPERFHFLDVIVSVFLFV
jgi:hypothetical protein